MFDKHFVGLDLTGIQDNGKQQPISRVTLVVDDENAYTAGDDTGMELSSNCPFATQEMVDQLLRQVKGYQYQMLRADDVRIDPAAELGDGVTAGGLYSVISRIDDDGSGFPSVAAPGEADTEDDLSYEGPMTQEFNRKVAAVRSQILKTAESITLRVENEIKGLRGELTLTAERLAAEIENTAEGLSSRLELTASNFQVQINGLNSAYSNISQTVDSISLGVFNGSDSSTITLYKNGIAVQSQNITFTGAVTFNDLNGSAGTIINGGAIDTDTLRVHSLYGDYIYIMDHYGGQAAMIYATSASSYEGEKFQLQSAAIDLWAVAGDLYLHSGRTSIQITNGGDIQAAGNFIPESDARYTLGSSWFRWRDVYASNSQIVTSDRERKKDVGYGLERYEAFFDALRPVSYRLIDGQSGRTHLGLIAQDVEQSLADCGLTDMDFAGLIRSPREDGGEDYALRYGEFIALLIARVQNLTARVAELERRIAG